MDNKVAVISLRKKLVKPFKNQRAKVWGDGMLNVKTDRRAHDRIPAKTQVRFFYGNRVYAGRVLDISEKGMFISTDMCLPVHSRLEIMMLVDGKVVNIPVTVRRTVNEYNTGGETANSGMGVELTRSVQEYVHYLSNLKSYYHN